MYKVVKHQTAFKFPVYVQLTERSRHPHAFCIIRANYDPLQILFPTKDYLWLESITIRNNTGIIFGLFQTVALEKYFQWPIPSEEPTYHRVY